MDHPRRLDVAVVEAALGAGKRTTVVRADHQECIFQRYLPFELVTNQTDEVIEAAEQQIKE